VARRGQEERSHLRRARFGGSNVESIGDEWIAGVALGRIGRRKGKGKPYTETTIRDYTRSYRNFVRPEFGPMPANDIGEVEWQMWIDELSREGLTRSRISTHVAVDSTLAGLAGAVIEVPTARSVRFGGSVFEQSALLLLDAIVLDLVAEDPQAQAAMQARHANLQ
jgi:hypothetical protein